MTYFEIGQKVRLTGRRWKRDYPEMGTDIVTVDMNRDGTPWSKVAGSLGNSVSFYGPDNESDYAVELIRGDAVNPDHYKFPGGTEVRQISAHLTSFGGQALQYIARSTRLDGKNKGDSVENLRKALAFLEWEIERLESDNG